MKNSKANKLFFQFLKKSGLAAAKSFWPNVISYKKVKTRGVNRNYAILKTQDGANYFLKIVPANWFSNKNILILKTNKLFGDKINTPKLLDYRGSKDVGGEKSLWLLYEYIKPLKKLNTKNIEAAVKELIRFHNLKIKNKQLGSQYFLQKNITHDIYTVNFKMPRCLKIKILSAINFFHRNNNTPKGFCHFDLKNNHFIITPPKVYLVDFEMTIYSYIIFDLALFIERLILERKYKLAAFLIKDYYKFNKRLVYDKKLLYCSMLMAINYLYKQGEINLAQLSRIVSDSENLFKNNL